MLLDNAAHDGQDGTFVADLREALRLDNRARVCPDATILPNTSLAIGAADRARSRPAR